MTDTTMLIDIRMVDGSHKPTLRRKGRVVVFHMQIQNESAGSIDTIWWSLHDNFPERHIALADVDVHMRMRVDCDALNLG